MSANRISSITKNGFLIPLAEEVIHVLNDTDVLFITLAKEDKNDHGEKASKKEKL